MCMSVCMHVYIHKFLRALFPNHVPCKRGVIYPLFTNGEDGLQICRVTVNVLNKQ